MLTKAHLINLLFTIQSHISVDGPDCDAPYEIYVQLNSGPISLGEAWSLAYNQLSQALRFEMDEQLKRLASDEAKRDAYEVQYRRRLEKRRQTVFENFEAYLLFVRDAWDEREKKQALTAAAQRDIRYYSALREFEADYVDCVIEAEWARRGAQPEDDIDDPDDDPSNKGDGPRMN